MEYIKINNDCSIERKQVVDIKKLKEYQYDSLVYRYIRAREQMAEYECKSGIYNYKKCKEMAQRDILKFCKILNEVIGDHE